MNTAFTSNNLVALIEKHPTFQFVAKVNFKRPYRGGEYERTIYGSGLCDMFADGSFNNTTANDPSEYMFCMSDTQGDYDVHLRISELEGAIKGIYDDVEITKALSKSTLSSSKRVLDNHLALNVHQKLEVIGDSGLANEIPYLKQGDLEVAASIDLCIEGEPHLDGLRLHPTDPTGMFIDKANKAIVVEFNETDDNYSGFDRMIELEAHLEKLIESAQKSKTGKPHATMLKKAKGFALKRIITA